MEKTNNFIRIQNQLINPNAVDALGIERQGDEIEININHCYYRFDFFGASVQQREELLSAVQKLSEHVTPEARKILDDIIANSKNETDG